MDLAIQFGAFSDDDGYWIDDPTTDLSEPSGGLFGGAAIINVAEGTMYSYDAKAINGWNDSGFDSGFGSDSATAAGSVATAGGVAAG